MAEQTHTLTSYEPVVVDLPRVQVRVEEIDAAMLAVPKQHAAYFGIPDRPIQSGDIVVIDIESTRDGEPVPELTQEHALLRLGNGDMPEEFEEQLAKVAIGTTATIEYDAPMAADDYGQNIEMVHVVSKVTPTGLRQEVIPALTDKWVAENIPGCNTVAELRDAETRKIVSRKRDELMTTMPKVLAGKLAERLVGDVSEEDVERDWADQNERLDAALADAGFTRDDLASEQGMTREELDEQLREDVRQTLREGSALVALAEHLGVEVGDEDIADLLDAPTPAAAEQLRTQYEEAGMTQRLVEGAMGLRAVDHLVRTAVFKKPDGTVDEAFAARLVAKYDEQLAERAAKREGNA